MKKRHLSEFRDFNYTGDVSRKKLYTKAENLPGIVKISKLEKIPIKILKI